MKKASKADISASLYGDTFDFHCDCPGEANCKLAWFYVQPPQPGDACAKYGSGGQCTDPRANRAALEALRDVIAVHLSEDDSANAAGQTPAAHKETV